MMQRERSDVYIIPPNFAKEGTLFSGRIEGRNAFEAAVLFIVLFRILFFIDVSIKLRIYIGIIVILPLTILAVVGVNGESLLSFIIQFIRFVTRRRVVTVPDGQYAELIKSLGMKEAITRRFFLIFEYPSRSGSKNPDERDVHLYIQL